MAAADRTKINLNLDTLEREESHDPFTVALTGKDEQVRTITMTDPAELDWQVLLEIENPIQFLRHCLSEDDRDWLNKQKIPGWKFNKLIEAYIRHFGLDTRGNAGGSRI